MPKHNAHNMRASIKHTEKYRIHWIIRWQQSTPKRYRERSIKMISIYKILALKVKKGKVSSAFLSFSLLELSKQRICETMQMHSTPLILLISYSSISHLMPKQNYYSKTARYENIVQHQWICIWPKEREKKPKCTRCPCCTSNNNGTAVIVAIATLNDHLSLRYCCCWPLSSSINWFAFFASSSFSFSKAGGCFLQFIHNFLLLQCHSVSCHVCLSVCVMDV